jgi:hypothetical protein
MSNDPAGNKLNVLIAAPLEENQVARESTFIRSDATQKAHKWERYTSCDLQVGAL